MAAAIGIAKTATEIFLGVGEVSIDNLTFKLHYRYSVTLLVAASVLVQTSQFFGDPVQCETVWYDLTSNLMNNLTILRGEGATHLISVRLWNFIDGGS